MNGVTTFNEAKFLNYFRICTLKKKHDTKGKQDGAELCKDQTQLDYIKLG